MVMYFKVCRFEKQCFSLFRELQNGMKRRLFATNYEPRRRNVWLLGFVGVSAGAFLGAGYSYQKYKDLQKPLLSLVGKETVLSELPKVDVSRKVVFADDNTGLQLKLFQYATCPFCCKVRAFLDYHGISYDIIEVNPVLRQQIGWSQYKKVPIVLTENRNNYQQLNDSSMIISVLMSYLIDKGSTLEEITKFYPSVSYSENGQIKTEILNRYSLMRQDKTLDETKKEAIILEMKWRKWVDNTLVHVLSPNVYRTCEEALETFNWFSQAGDWEKHFLSWERHIVVYFGAFAMWLISKRLKKRHNLKDDVRQSFYDECNVWMKALNKQGTPFMGGDKPNLADLAVYGVLSSIEGSRAFQDVLKHTTLGKWYWVMKSQVKNHEGRLVSER